MKNKKSILINSFIVGVVLVVAFLSVYLYSPPEVIPADAPLSAFSAERAMTHVDEMCQKPHFIGTEEHARVRDYIVAEAGKLGLVTEIQSTTAVLSYRHNLITGRVQNIIATLKGTHPGKAVLIAGHYDSVPHAPGAADDGSAVAAMLETARALTHSQPLKNDIIFLFTDGEEEGLLGAQAFTAEHPDFKKVGVVFNLEARGNSGTSVTFEVSSENGWLMKEYAKAVPYPFAASVMYEVYKRMPNNTDFTIFKMAGAPGFNAAFIDGFVNYHSMTDSPANLDRRSLQHHGSYILNIARHFGNLIIANTKEKDVVFFNPIGNWLVLFPGGLNLPLVILAVLLYLLYLVLGLKKKQLTGKGIIGGFFLYLSGVVLIVLLYWLVQTGIKVLYPQYGHFYSHNFYNIHFYFYLMVGMIVGLFSALYFLLFKRLKTGNLLAGAMALFVIIMIFLYAVMSTAAYLVIFPLIFLLLAGIISQVLNLNEENNTTAYALLHLLAVLPAVALYVPMIKMLFIAFSLRMGFVSAALLLLLLGFLIPWLKRAYDLNKYALPVLALVIALIAFAGGHLTSRPSKERPLHTSLMYGLDADQQKALWISAYLEPDDWNQSFFTKSRVEPLKEIFPVNQQPYLVADAPTAAVSLPVVNLLEDHIENGSRKLHFNLTSTRQADTMILLFHKDAGITHAEIAGKPLVADKYKDFYEAGESGYHALVYYAVPPEGIDLVMECREGSQLRLVVLEWKLGLPSLPGFNYSLPPHIIPDMEESHMTLLKKLFLL